MDGSGYPETRKRKGTQYVIVFSGYVMLFVTTLTKGLKYEQSCNPFLLSSLFGRIEHVVNIISGHFLISGNVSAGHLLLLSSLISVYLRPRLGIMIQHDPKKSSL